MKCNWHSIRPSYDAEGPPLYFTMIFSWTKHLAGILSNACPVNDRIDEEEGVKMESEMEANKA